MDPAVVKSRIRHAEKERARREKSHTETLAYIRTKLFSAVEERALETALFIIVLRAVFVSLWNSKTADVKHKFKTKKDVKARLENLKTPV